MQIRDRNKGWGGNVRLPHDRMLCCSGNCSRVCKRKRLLEVYFAPLTPREDRAESLLWQRLIIEPMVSFTVPCRSSQRKGPNFGGCHFVFLFFFLRQCPARPDDKMWWNASFSRKTRPLSASIWRSKASICLSVSCGATVPCLLERRQGKVFVSLLVFKTESEYRKPYWRSQ